MSKFNFIKTSDDDTKNKLISLGFKLISQDGNVYTFINNSTMSFDDNKLKVKYSNMLAI